MLCGFSVVDDDVEDDDVNGEGEDNDIENNETIMEKKIRY
jgi:hypothetical protein